MTILFLVTISCNKDELFKDSGALLRFSSDTVSFDTIFTGIGSATLQLKVHNPYPQSVLISSISLAGGTSSFFKLNVDGEYTQTVNNVKLPPKDSLYIFVAVTIDPLNINNPLIIKDSVVFLTNGNYQDVKLIAYGQDVYLMNGEVIESEIWTDDKPYLIYNTVTVDTGETLTIEPGAQLFFHNNSSLVISGKLIINGSGEKPVVLQHDRPEEFYDIIPGQWGTIFIDPLSTGNKINHAIIRNSVAGIYIGSPTSGVNANLELTNSMIQNVSFAGIYASGANINCTNTIIADCGGPALALLKGGNYTFVHCTISNHGVIGSSRTSPSVELSNFIYHQESDSEPGEFYSGDLETATFHNCIIYGLANHELEFNDNDDNTFNYYFNHCLIKASSQLIDTTDHSHFNSLILNEYPEFVNDSDRYHLDLQLDTLSPAKDAGDPSIFDSFPLLIYDLNGDLRNVDSGPDLGALERRED